MDEVVKRRLIRIWLGVLYVTLWSLFLAAVLVAATWLLGLWRYAAFAGLGLAIGAYLSRRADSIVDQVVRGILVIGAAGLAIWMSITVAAVPRALASYSLSVVTFVLYGGALLATIRFVRRLLAPETETEETIQDAGAGAETKLEVVPETEAESELTPAGRG